MTRVPLPAGLAPARASAIEILADKWVNGTVLHFHFLENAPDWNWPDDQKAIVRAAFDIWKNLGIGLSFIEVDDPGEAEICIGRDQNDGSWSYVGTDILRYKDRGRTMNFGWDLRTEWGRATALHEIGHTLGLAHEHQNPKAGIVWNEAAVYDHFSRPPNNWDHVTIYENILKKIPAAEIAGSSWSPDSIMEYPFDPGLIVAPKPFDEGVPANIKLAQSDVEWVRYFYPEELPMAEIAPLQIHKLTDKSAGQCNFIFKPMATREYKIQTVGESDSRVVVFEQRDGEPRYLTAGDDSGVDSNLAIAVRMVKGRLYVIRVRVHYIAGDGAALVLV
jgi:hypothetical protein